MTGLSTDIENLIFMTARFTGRNLAIVHDFVNVTIMRVPFTLDRLQHRRRCTCVAPEERQRNKDGNHLHTQAVIQQASRMDRSIHGAADEGTKEVIMNDSKDQ